MKIKLNSDVFNITKRIKNINRNYLIYFDTINKKYQIVSNNHIIYTLPFDHLDERTINYIKRQQLKTNEIILQELENINAKRIFEINNQIIENSIMVAENVLRRS